MIITLPPVFKSNPKNVFSMSRVSVRVQSRSKFN
jgi:hypothetical protein